MCDLLVMGTLLNLAMCGNSDI